VAARLQRTGESVRFGPEILGEWGYRSISISILKLHLLSAVCQSFVSLCRATYESGALEKKYRKITVAKHTRQPLIDQQCVNKSIIQHEQFKLSERLSNARDIRCRINLAQKSASRELVLLCWSQCLFWASRRGNSHENVEFPAERGKEGEWKGGKGEDPQGTSYSHRVRGV